MKVLMAEDEAVSRRLLESHLRKWGYEVVCTRDGNEAWHALQADRAIEMAVLDWMMPEVDGTELCQRIRADLSDRSIYLLLCTARDEARDIVEGLEAGADDYICKPLNRSELRARLRVGERTVALETTLRKRIADLDHALAHVTQLQGLLPICMHCHGIRDDKDVWHRIEDYIAAHTDARFSHSLCKQCLEKHYPDNSTW